MSDESSRAQEEQEAEALARALEGQGTDAPSDALEIAALLRYARGQDEATPGQLERARAGAERAPVRMFGRRSMRVLAGTLAAAAVALLALLSSEAPESSAPAPRAQAPASAPRASSLARLLDAQGEALARPDTPLTGLSAASALHRRDLFASLSARYGGDHEP